MFNFFVRHCSTEQSEKVFFLNLEMCVQALNLAHLCNTSFALHVIGMSSVSILGRQRQQNVHWYFLNGCVKTFRRQLLVFVAVYFTFNFVR